MSELEEGKGDANGRTGNRMGNAPTAPSGAESKRIRRGGGTQLSVVCREGGTANESVRARSHQEQIDIILMLSMV